MAGSEIARLKQQIATEVHAMRQALEGYATVGRHQIINRRFANLGQHMTQLSREVGEQRAIEVVAEALEQAKPTLGEVRRTHGLTTTQLAETAGIPLREVYQAEIGVAIGYGQAICLLEALNTLSEQQYTLEMVHISIKHMGGSDDGRADHTHSKR